jgi:hypothetical protein
MLATTSLQNNPLWCIWPIHSNMLQITNFWASLHNVHSLHNYFIVDAFNPSKFYQKQLQWLTPSDCIFKSLFLGKLKAGVQRTTVKLRAVPLNNSDEREKKKCRWLSWGYKFCRSTVKYSIGISSLYPDWQFCKYASQRFDSKQSE